MNKKKVFLVTIAAAFASAAILVVSAKQKSKRNWLFVGLLFSAIAGFVGAIALSYHQRHKKRENLKVDQLIDSMDADRLDEHISEVLGRVSTNLLHD